MRAERRFALAALAIAGALASARDARAFCRTTTVSSPADGNFAGCASEGLPIFWRGACVGYSVQQDASAQIPLDEATRAIAYAFSSWTRARCGDATRPSLDAVDLGPVACDAVRYDPKGPNQNVIVFRDGGWPHDDPGYTLALTTVTFDTDTGEIFDADVEINSHDHRLTVGDGGGADTVDFVTVMTHEAGHFLGLAHTPDETAAMYATYNPLGGAHRDLRADDVEAVCSVYRADGTRAVDTSVAASGGVAATACDPTPRHGLSSTCDGSAPAPTAPPAPAASAPTPLVHGHGCAMHGGGDGTPAAILALLALVGIGRRRR